MIFLFNRRENEYLYVFKGLLLGIIVTIPLVETKRAFFPDADTVELTLTPFMIVMASVLGPIIETALMLVLLEVIRCFTNQFLRVCVISALLWGLIHSSNGS